MYHDVYCGRSSSLIPRSAAMYHVSAAQFRSHLDAIERSRVGVLTVGQFLGGGFKPADSVALTFDDGWQGAFEVAMPLLLERGWRATFFITRDFVGRQGFCDAYMLRDAVAAGMEIGIHGTTHRMLSACSAAAVLEEFRACRVYLEDCLQRPVVHASLPGGDLTTLVIGGAREAGVESLCTSRPGLNFDTTSRFKLRRVAIRESTTGDDVARFCRFDLRRDQGRWLLLQVLRTTVGMKRYSHLRRLILRERAGHAGELFEP
jgi:peptidoglycan/xylan/chitin deacetylase (PgdA/CDA1 family)